MVLNPSPKSQLPQFLIACESGKKLGWGEAGPEESTTPPLPYHPFGPPVLLPYLTVSEHGFVHFVVAVDFHQSVVAPHDQIEDAVAYDVIVVQAQDSPAALLIARLPSVHWRVPTSAKNNSQNTSGQFLGSCDAETGNSDRNPKLGMMYFRHKGHTEYKYCTKQNSRKIQNTNLFLALVEHPKQCSKARKHTRSDPHVLRQ